MSYQIETILTLREAIAELTQRVQHAETARRAITEEMVERAAMAACNHDPSLKRWEDFGERNPLKPDEWWVSPDIGQNWWRGIARAALIAALTPPEKQRGYPDCDCSCGQVERCSHPAPASAITEEMTYDWQAACDAYYEAVDERRLILPVWKQGMKAALDAFLIRAIDFLDFKAALVEHVLEKLGLAGDMGQEAPGESATSTGDRRAPASPRQECVHPSYEDRTTGAVCHYCGSVGTHRAGGGIIWPVPASDKGEE